MKAKTYWTYCDKFSGEPVIAGSQLSIHLMTGKPTEAQCKGYGGTRGMIVVARPCSLTFPEKHKTGDK